MNRVFKDGVELFDVTVTIIGDGAERSTTVTSNKPIKPGAHALDDPPPPGDGGHGEPPPPKPR